MDYACERTNRPEDNFGYRDRCVCGTRHVIRSPHHEALPAEYARLLRSAVEHATTNTTTVVVETVHYREDYNGLWFVTEIGVDGEMLANQPFSPLTHDHRGYTAPAATAERLTAAGWVIPADLNAAVAEHRKPGDVGQYHWINQSFAPTEPVDQVARQICQAFLMLFGPVSLHGFETRMYEDAHRYCADQRRCLIPSLAAPARGEHADPIAS